MYVGGTYTYMYIYACMYAVCISTYLCVCVGGGLVHNFSLGVGDTVSA